MDDFAERLVFELQLGGAHLFVIGQLRRGARSPGHNPMYRLGCKRERRKGKSKKENGFDFHGKINRLSYRVRGDVAQPILAAAAFRGGSASDHRNGRNGLCVGKTV